MMVDDEPILVEVVRSFLATSGFQEFMGITDPTKAIEAIRTQRPDLLLLDLMMPKVNGFEVLRAVRADPHLKMLPVVVMTSASDAATKLKVLELGATDFLEKPVDPSELSLRVRNTLAFKAFSERMAFFDALTGLPNRAFLESQLASQVRRSTRKKTSFAVLQIDLDRFNKVNESLGHRNADLLLINVAERIQACIRDLDSLGRSPETMGPRHVANSLSRVGGDEFTAVLVDLPNNRVAGQIAKRIQDAICRPYHINNQELFITASIGIASFPEDGRDREELLRNAESANREAKRGGVNNICYFNASYNRESADRLALENQLHRAVERCELQLYYQPKIDVKTLKIVGAEALMRWAHPERGLLPATVFIPIAEQSQLISEIGAWAIDEACRQYASWQSAGLPEFKIAVNVATAQLMQGRLAQDIRTATEKHGVKPAQLIIEITESMLMQSGDDADSMIKGVVATGVSLSLDDFGTGFASLGYLKRLPLAELKIDRSFVDGLPEDKGNTAIVSAVVALAQNLGLKVTAEGVETGAQLRTLQKLGCDQFQGFLRSKPVPADEFARMMRQG